jgi:hypothetical protein
MVIAGRPPQPSSLHSFYVMLEVLKLVLLAAMMMASGRTLVKHGPAIG